MLFAVNETEPAKIHTVPVAKIIYDAPADRSEEGVKLSVGAGLGVFPAVSRASVARRPILHPTVGGERLQHFLCSKS